MTTIDMSALWREDATKDEQIAVYQHLVNTGEAWRLEGSVGRTAMDLIRAGVCALGTEAHTDFYGCPVPSRTQVEAGTPGSAEFVEAQGYEVIE